MTRVIPQIVNTKNALRSAVLALPDNAKVQALLGLDGDCDFSVRASESYPFRCSKEDLECIDPDAIKGKKITSYGAEAIVAKDKIPAGMEVFPVDLEQLFVFMVKEV